MPSFRLLVDVHDVRAGHAPEEVEETLVAGVARRAFVEAHDLDVVAGVPRLRVRFLVPDSSPAAENALAAGVREEAVSAASQVAVLGTARVLRRTPRGRWLAVGPSWTR